MLKSQADKTARMAPLGFCCPAANPETEPVKLKTTMPEDCLLCFDGGEQVSFADATHNNIVMGTTGSGKSTQIILPALASLIKAGFGGVILDVKGNVTDQVRMIANEYGRLDDVVEFGPGPMSTKVNLFAGASPDRREALFNKIFCMVETSAENSIFRQDGMQKGQDVLDLQLIICRKLGIDFNFGVYRRLINDAQFAHDLYSAYKSKLYNKNDARERSLVQRIEGDRLHYILHSCTMDKAPRDWAQQTSYRMSYVRGAVESFYRSPGLAENFLAGVDENLDIARRVYDEQKIVVLRLAVETGDAGLKIASHILREYYQAVYRRGKRLDDRKYTFCIADEFQDFYDSSRCNPLNDNAFVAKCREFRCIAMYGTQSLAAMHSQAERQIDAETFVANNNMRLFLYSDDRHTQDLAPEGMRHLDRLAPGKGVLVKYNVATREHLVGEVSMQRMHDLVQEIFRRQAIFVPASAPVSVFADESEDDAIAREQSLQEACDMLLRCEPAGMGQKHDGRKNMQKLLQAKHLLDEIADDGAFADIDETLGYDIDHVRQLLVEIAHCTKDEELNR